MPTASKPAPPMISRTATSALNSLAKNKNRRHHARAWYEYLRRHQFEEYYQNKRIRSGATDNLRRTKDNFGIASTKIELDAKNAKSSQLIDLSSSFTSAREDGEEAKRCHNEELPAEYVAELTPYYQEANPPLGTQSYEKRNGMYRCK